MAPGATTASTSAVLRATTSSPADTRALAAAITGLLRPGDVVSLSGELGAGKTCFVQGLAAALGVDRRVTSPTFMLLRVYEEADPPLVHVDVYRLERLQDVLDLGDEVMAPDRVTVVEWGDAIAALLPDDHLEIEVLLGSSASSPAAPLDPDRVLLLRPRGGWRDRFEDLRAACAPWVG